jgi:hypothetical protein
VPRLQVLARKLEGQLGQHMRYKAGVQSFLARQRPISIRDWHQSCHCIFILAHSTHAPRMRIASIILSIALSILKAVYCSSIGCVMVGVGPGFGRVKPRPAELGLKIKRDNPDLKPVQSVPGIHPGCQVYQVY